MPPRRLSRYTFSDGFTDPTDGSFMLEDPEPFSYVDRPDTRVHEVRGGDRLDTLAELYFPSFDRPAGLWWIIADFQPDPIIDPTRELPIGSTIFVPSERVVLEEIFSEERRLQVTE